MNESGNALTRKGTKHTQRRHAVGQDDDWSTWLLLIHTASIAPQTVYSGVLVRLSSFRAKGGDITTYLNRHGNDNEQLTAELAFAPIRISATLWTTLPAR